MRRSATPSSSSTPSGASSCLDSTERPRRGKPCNDLDAAEAMIRDAQVELGGKPCAAAGRAACWTRRRPRCSGPGRARRQALRRRQALLSPSMHNGDVCVPSGLRTERAQTATNAEHESWP